MISARHSSVTLLFLCAIVMLPFAGLLSGDGIPLLRDLLTFFLPFKIFLAENLKRGEIPLWNPWIFMGTPFLASLHTGVLYPPSVFLLLPFPLAFNAFVLFHYLVAVAGAYALLRNRRLSLAASSIGSLSFVIGGYLVSMLNVTNNLQSAAWAPAAMFFWSRRLDGGSWRSLAGFVIVVAMQLLGGAPEVVLMTVLLVSAWTAYRSWADWSAALRSELTLSAAFLLAIGLTAFQLLPTLELLRESSRGTAFTFEHVSFWSLEPISLLQFLFPHSASLVTPEEQGSLGQLLATYLPWIRSIYLGLVPLCLLAAGLTCGRERLFWGLVTTIGVILALGKHTPVFGFLYELLPTLFGRFRYPEKFFFLSHFAAMIVCAEGAERIVRGDRVAGRIASITALVFIGFGGTILVLAATRPMDLLRLLAVLRGLDLPLMAFGALATDMVFKSQRLVLILGTFFGLLLLWRHSLIRHGLACSLLVGLVAADLAGAHYDLNLATSWSKLLGEPCLVDLEEVREHHWRVFNYQKMSAPRWGSETKPIQGLEESAPIVRNTDDLRAFALTEWPSLFANVGMIYRVGTIGGGDGIDRREIERLRDVLAILPRERAVDLLRVFSVAYLVGSEPLEVRSIREIRSGPSHFVYRIEEPLPPAYLVERLRVAGSWLDAFNVIIASDFEPGKEAAVERLPTGWVDGATKNPAGEASIVLYENDRVVLRVRASDHAFLVLNDSYFPGWEVRIDEAPAEIIRTNGLVRGVAIPAGTHAVEFSYHPSSLRTGIRISALAGIILFGWIVLDARSSRSAGTS